MAAQYYLYCTTLNNTVICRGNNSFAPLPPNTGELYYDILIPETQPLYLYRESGSSIVFNSQENIEEYVQEMLPPPTMDDYVTYSTFSEYSGITAPNTYYNKIQTNSLFVNVSGDTMTGSLNTSGNFTAAGLVSGSSVCGGTWIHTPIMCADNCVRTGFVCSLGAISAVNRVSGSTVYGSTCLYSPITCGTTCAVSPITCGSTCLVGGAVKGTIVSGSTCVYSPITCGTTRIQSPVVCGTTCVISPIVFGSTCVCSPTICSSTCLCSNGTTRLIGATTAASTLNVSGITRLGNTTCLVSTPAVGSISTDRTLFWNPTDKQVKAIQLTGGSDNYFYCHNNTPASTTQTTCQLYIGYCPTTFIGGRYQVDFNAALKNSATNRCSLVAFKVDGVIQGVNIIQYGVATSSPYVSRDITLTAGTHCFDIYYWSQAGTTTIYYGTIRVKRIG